MSGFGGTITRVGGACTISRGSKRPTSSSAEAFLERWGFHPPESVILRDQGERMPAAFQVALGSEARAALLEEVRRVHRDAGRPVEVGGWLFAARRPTHRSRSLEICHASWAGPGARNGDFALALGDAYAVQAELPPHLSHVARVGDWHTHPIPGADPIKPSTQDMRSMAGMADRLGLSHYVGIIAAPSLGGWDFPKDRSLGRAARRPSVAAGLLEGGVELVTTSRRG